MMYLTVLIKSIAPLDLYGLLNHSGSNWDFFFLKTTILNYVFGTSLTLHNTKKHTTPIMKPGGGSIMLCGGFSAEGPGRLY